MADALVHMDMLFLRTCATSHDVVEKGEELTSALGELAEEDTVFFQCFMQARFNVFFEEDVKAEMKALMSVQQWQCVYVRKECLAALRCFLDWKQMFGEADLEFATLQQSQIQVLSGLQCSEEDRPKLRDQFHEKMTAWLTALPGSLRKCVEEIVLVTTWKQEHFFGALVEFFELKKQSSQPTTPPSLSQNSASANFATPEKRTRTSAAFPESSQPTTPTSSSQNSSVANFATPEKRTRTSAAFPEYTGLSPVKKCGFDSQQVQLVEAENVDSKFTPLDKVGSTYKIRHSVRGKVLMVGHIKELKCGPNKDRLVPKISFIIGSKTGTMEISAIGQHVQRCFEQVSALKGQVASLSNTVFEKNMARSAMVKTH